MANQGCCGQGRGERATTAEVIISVHFSKVQSYGGRKNDEVKPAYGDFLEYIKETNKKLFNNFNQLVQESREGKKKRDWAHIVAPARFGKSTLFTLLQKQLPESIYFIKLERLKDRLTPNDPSGISLREVNDLADVDASGKGPKSSMLGFGQEGTSSMIQPAPDLLALLKIFGINIQGKKSAFIIIDSIDEIHPESAASLLRAIDDGLQSGEGLPNFCHIYVVGRPEGFANTPRADAQSGEEDQLDLLALRTLATGGTVFAVPQDQMPDISPVAAILRC